ncbi:unnamed protein product, partial [Anisakis simplex]|uniref:Uncharacterized protein n=1 Tax=Anisakis simplex TaxID=6269 RepID=A0A0M3JJU3_ANISI
MVLCIPGHSGGKYVEAAGLRTSREAIFVCCRDLYWVRLDTFPAKSLFVIGGARRACLCRNALKL